MIKKLQINQSGIVHLLPLLLIILIVSVVILLITGIIKNPFSKQGLDKSSQKVKAGLTIQEDYKNPFDTSTQYLNPFATYKNPFESLKASKK